MGIAVASGGVLRALNKEFGPQRKVRTSIGLSRKIPFEPTLRDEHKGLPLRFVEYDKLDDINYVGNSIKWFIKRVSLG
jgi:hypothetical protein